MKKFLAVLLITGMVLMGCAGMQTKAPETLAEYYCTDEAGYTDPCPRDEDIQFVIDVEVTFDVHKVWLDYRHAIVALTATDEDGNCNGNAIWVEDMELATSVDYSTVRVRANRNIDCERFNYSLAEQLTEEYHEFVKEQHEAGRMD